MNITSIWNWIKSNMIISIIVLVGVVIIFFPKLLGGLFGRKRVRHHRRSIPRSVGIHRVRHRTPTQRRSKGAKKPWQIKGSLAARQRMARIRRMR